MEDESILIDCTSCRTRLSVPASVAGKNARCPQCRSVVAVPADLPPVAEVVLKPQAASRVAASPPPEDDGPPFFMAIEPRNFTPNRLYRVYILPDELVAVWAGGCNDVALYLTAGAGLLGGLIAAAMNPTKKNASRKEELDTLPLEELRDDHKHNFAVGFDAIEDAEVIAPSFWFKINHATVPHFGLLRFRCRARGRTTLALCSNEDVGQVLDQLPDRLDDRLQVGLEWDARTRQYRDPRGR